MAVPGALAPIAPPESNAWNERLRRIFNVKFVDALWETRGVGSGYDLNPNETNGYVYARPTQRNSIAVAEYNQGKRGQMAGLPTPQDLIRQVTGIGDPVRGR